MSIKIDGIVKEETAYDKEITLTYEGESYAVRLHWDKWDGYEVTFTDTANTRNWIDTPDWAINWEDNNDGESLAYVLDGLTDEVLEASYL
jgi:hypothetical protein